MFPLSRRKAEHEAANAERKLTPGQKKEKNLRKLKEDTTAGVSVTVYRYARCTVLHREQFFCVDGVQHRLYNPGIIYYFVENGAKI